MARVDRRNPFERAQATTATVTDQTTVELYFDYNTVPAEQREALRRSALTIKPRLKRAAEDLFVIGRELMAVKIRLPHGTYAQWLDIEFGLSDRMAQRFMNVAERLGSKSDKLSVLPPSTLYLLAAPSTPDAAIDSVEQHLTKGERITVAFVQHAILAARQKTDPAPPLVIDSEVVNRERVSRVVEQRQMAVQRLEQTLTSVIALLSGTTEADWQTLFQTDAVKRLREQACLLQAMVQQRNAER